MNQHCGDEIRGEVEAQLPKAVNCRSKQKQGFMLEPQGKGAHGESQDEAYQLGDQAELACGAN